MNESLDAIDAEPFDEESRALCPDGSCTGLIGPDGRCKVCGAQGELPTPYRSGQPVPLLDERPAPLLAAVESESEGDFDDDRQLCPDGACTGLLGEDGRCKVCGRTV